jgi:hypothetical protein
VPAETQVSAKMKTKMNKRLKRLYLSWQLLNFPVKSSA